MKIRLPQVLLALGVLVVFVVALATHAFTLETSDVESELTTDSAGGAADVVVPPAPVQVAGSNHLPVVVAPAEILPLAAPFPVNVRPFSLGENCTAPTPLRVTFSPSVRSDIGLP